MNTSSATAGEYYQCSVCGAIVASVQGRPEVTMCPRGCVKIIRVTTLEVKR